MRKISLLFSFLILFTSCEKTKKIEAQETAQEPQVVTTAKPFENLFNDTLYSEKENYLRFKIDLQFTYEFTPEAKANPDKTNADYNNLLAEIKERYSLTDSQVNKIRNGELYIGMHKTCVLLAWGRYRTMLNRPTERKSVDANGEISVIGFNNGRSIRYANFLNDILVSYEE